MGRMERRAYTSSVGNVCAYREAAVKERPPRGEHIGRGSPSLDCGVPDKDIAALAWRSTQIGPLEHHSGSATDEVRGVERADTPKPDRVASLVKVIFVTWARDVRKEEGKVPHGSFITRGKKETYED